MREESYLLDEIEPSSELDRRVWRRMKPFTRRKASRTKAAPFLPFEGAVYAVVLAAYALSTGARAIQLFHQARVQQIIPYVADGPVGGRSSPADGLLGGALTRRARS